MFRRVRRPSMSARAMLMAVALVLVVAGAAAAEPNQADELQQQAGRVLVSAPVTPYAFNGDLRGLTAPAEWQPGDPVKEIPRRFYSRDGFVQPDYATFRDPLAELQKQWTEQLSSEAPLAPEAIESFTTPSRSFPGSGYTSVNPPDTVGDVGPSYYIQAVNMSGGTRVRIFDKAEPTPAEVSNFALDSLGSGACAGGYGDPVVLYDRFAERWMLTEFATSGNHLCVYISQTADPVSGGWYNYDFSPPSFPDYPKYGVWPTDKNGGDGSYVVTSNDGGPGIYALDRGKMLNGEPATFIRMAIPGLPGFGFETPTPADLDGGLHAPPATAPAIIMRHRDTENQGGPAAPGDLLEMWTFDVDWTNTANSVLTQEPSIDIDEFDSDLCGLSSFFCFPQPGTGTTLDPLREVLMHRLQYMNHGDYETLVGNMVTDVDGTDHGGVRWFELRRTGGASQPWVKYQEGTYSIDDDNRWMASIAMDQSNNIALAYNVSSGSTFPSLRYTGRQADDTLGVMTQPEAVIHAGTASNSSNRYGDYASMNLDPSDDCTFWFTGMDNTSSNWRTQIASFRFDACGCDLFPSALDADAVVSGDNQVELTWNDADLASVIEYRVYRARIAGGPYQLIATVPDSSPGVADDPAIYSHTDDTVSGGIDYFYIVRASDGGACTSAPSPERQVTATGSCTLKPLFAGLQSVSATPFGICKIDLFWGDATAECDGPISYNVYRSTDPSFIPGPANLIASGVIGNTLEDLNGLADPSTYYYAVRSVDDSNGSVDTNTVRLGASPQGVDGMCVTGSSCSDNPFVDVDPEGPETVCQGGGPLLTANLSSGTGPFVYQWYEDGVAVDGANGSEYLPDTLGTHSYNVRVRSQLCADEVFDGLDTQLTRVNQPFFSGIQSVTNPKNSTCTMDLAWNPATTVCDGPVRYFVYRDTQPNVQPIPANLIAAGLIGTSYSDAVELANEVTYHYLVRAQDFSTGQFDGNTKVLSSAPDGPGNGPNPIFLADFTSAASFSGWTVTTGPGSHSCGEWSLTSSSSSLPSGGSGQYVWANSNCGGLAPRTSASLDSPAIDGDVTDILSITLKANIRYTTGNGDDTTIEVWDGSQWVVIWNDPDASFNGQVTFDVTQYAAGNANFRVRFNYQNANADGYFAVDNVNVIADLLRPCSTEAAGPAPAPDGSLGTTPLRGDRLDDAGSSIGVTWDAVSCGAAEFNLLWGDLAGVSSYALGGAECSIGTGSYTWSGVPSGDLYFLVVSTDGAGVESSWGTDGGGAERNGSGVSGECSTASKNPSGTCP